MEALKLECWHNLKTVKQSTEDSTRDPGLGIRRVSVPCPNMVRLRLGCHHPPTPALCHQLCHKKKICLLEVSNGKSKGRNENSAFFFPLRLASGVVITVWTKKLNSTQRFQSACAVDNSNKQPFVKKNGGFSKSQAMQSPQKFSGRWITRLSILWLFPLAEIILSGFLAWKQTHLFLYLCFCSAASFQVIKKMYIVTLSRLMAS